VDAPGRKLVADAADMVQKAVAICGPGVPLNTIGRVIQQECDRHGYCTVVLH
jgi:methionyl aminopeptidase